RSEVQRVSLSTQGSGSFSLTLKDGATTYTTTGIQFGANAATVSYALNAALGAGSVSVTKEGTDYLVTFAGAFAGRDLPLLTVNTTPTQAVPGGAFKLSLGTATTAPISYSADGAVMAQRVQAALRALPSIGASGVVVSFNASASGSASLALDIRFSGTQGERPVTTLQVQQGTGFQLSNASAAVRSLAAGKLEVTQVQAVDLFDDAIRNGYRLGLTYQGRSYETALIAGNAGSAEVQAALRAALAPISGLTVNVGARQANSYTVSFAGELAGTRFNTMSLQVDGTTAPAVTGKGNFVVGNTAQNIANLKNAYAQLTSALTGNTVQPANIEVTYDSSYRGGERYVVRFAGALDWTDIPSKGIAFRTPLDYALIQNGAPAIVEQQTVSLDRTSAGVQGSFRLSLSVGAAAY
ncbi:MAG: hypothetical protein EB027_07545, partial [Actinobacteria bacterium]|nr:hypothetical protein [Actinomycetota bacterium]